MRRAERLVVGDDDVERLGVEQCCVFRPAERPANTDNPEEEQEFDVFPEARAARRGQGRGTGFPFL